MYYLVSVGHNSMAVHLTRSDCEGPNAEDEIDDVDTVWNDSE
jgi:hypothetical protein